MSALARTVLGFGAPILLLALVVGGEVGTWLFVVVSPAFPVALIVLGAAGESPDAANDPRVRRTAAVALVLGLSLEIGMVGVCVLERSTWLAATWLGLPTATWWMIVVLGWVPLALVPWAYARLSGPPARERRPPPDPDGREP